MPNIKAAEKWMRQTEKRTQANKDVKTRLKTVFKKAVAQNDAEFAKSVESQFDKAAKTGVIHPNKAARKKARLAKAVRAASSGAAVKSKATKSSKPAKTAKK